MSAADHGRARAPGRLGAAALSSALALAGGCAPIDSQTEVSIRPREAPTIDYGEAEHARSIVADYVQLGGRVLVELRARQQCVTLRHIPVLRVEEVERKTRGFVAWDFALGAVTGGLAGLAFARPEAFTKPLISADGRLVYNNSNAYVIGSVFAAISVGLLSAGIVNAVKARDTITYADAFELSETEPHPCPDGAGGLALANRPLTLFVADGVLEAEAGSDDQGRARFELRPWPPELPPPETGLAPAVLEIGRASEDDPRGPMILELELRIPFPPTEAHTGQATSLESNAAGE